MLCPPSLPQVIRQVENDIEKMLVKGRAGEKVTTLYLGVWDVLRKVSSPSLSHHPTRHPFPKVLLVECPPGPVRSSCSTPHPAAVRGTPEA